VFDKGGIDGTARQIKSFIDQKLTEQREEIVKEVEKLKNELHESGHEVRRQALNDVVESFTDKISTNVENKDITLITRKPI